MGAFPIREPRATVTSVTRPRSTPVNSPHISHTRAVVQLHFVALLWGFAGVLGTQATISSAGVAVGRSLCALLALVCWCGPSRVLGSLQLPSRALCGVFLNGLLLGLHWIFFFRSIALGGVAVGLVTYASAAGVIVLLEVLLGWARLSVMRVLAPLLSVAGVYVIAPSGSDSDLSMQAGLLFGLLSALVYAFMIVLGKGLMTRGAVKPLAVLSGQLVGATVIGIPVVVWQGIPPIGAHDLGVVVLLGVLCSAIGGGLFNRALVVVRSGTAAVITNMEAPYGVFLAWLLVGEQISTHTLLGVGLVTVAAILAARADSTW